MSSSSNRDIPGPALRAALADQRAGRRVEAERVYRRVRADTTEPAVRRAHATHLLGLLARECGHLAAAAGLLGESAGLLPGGDPAAAEFAANHAGALAEAGRWDEALAAAQRAVAAGESGGEAGGTGFAPAHHNLAVVLGHFKRREEWRACEIDPAYFDARLLRAETLRTLNRPAEAADAAGAAADLRPGDFRPRRLLGSLHADAGRTAEAVAARRRAADLAPDLAAVGSELLFTLHYDPANGPRELYAAARAWAEVHTDPHAPADPQFPNGRDPDRRLRVGYVSPDFRDHPIGRLLEPVLAGHDRGRFEAICYSGVEAPDAVGHHLRGLADGWVDLPGLTDDEVAAKVRADGIDVLVDCAGHFGDHRLGVFARRPAPVQVSAFGYCGTTGLRTIDHRLTDAASDPPGGAGAEAFHSEKLWRLPRVAWCYRPFDGAPDVGPPPAVENGFVTFGCFNNLVKVTDAVVETWSAILAAVPGSRLLLLGAAGDEHTARRFARHGIDPGRVEVAGRRPRAEYFALHNRVDVGLDPFPFNGDNTLCDALWMGVPSVALAGDRFAARRGLAHLAAVGLGHLAAESVEEYVGTAARLAADWPALADLRPALRQSVRASALGDAPAFVADLESAYRAMWRRRCG